MPPLLEAGAKDRLAYLLRAGRAHGALVFVEAQAAGLERQAAVFQQAAHFGFRVLDQVLVEDAVDAAGQDLSKCDMSST